MPYKSVYLSDDALEDWDTCARAVGSMSPFVSKLIQAKARELRRQPADPAGVALEELRASVERVALVVRDL